MVFTGDELVIWGGLPAHLVGSERAVGSKLDLETNEWSELPEPLPEPESCECNLGSQTLIWTGEYVLVSAGRFSTGYDPTTPVLIAYHPDSDTWTLVDEGSPVGRGGRALMVGDRVLVRSDRIYLSPPGWQPSGQQIPSEGL
jgi:hypothetical protein